MTSNADTKIRCHVCHADVTRGHVYCPSCGVLLSASQMRASSVSRLNPKQWCTHILEYAARLGRLPSPLSPESLRLHEDATALLSELRGLPDQENPPARPIFDRIVAWSMSVNAELQR